MQKKIILQNALAKVVVAPELGGSILLYEVTLNGKSVAVLKPSLDAKSADQSCYFPLTPYSNRIREGLFNWLGTDVFLPLNNKPEKHSLHGHGWQTAWKVIKKSDHSVQLEYQFKRAEWPFDYRVIQSIHLKDETLKIELTIINQDKTTMPAGLGFHPYFSRTPQCKVSVDTGKMWAADDECMPTELVNLPTDLKLTNGIKIDDFQLDNCFVGFRQPAVIVWPEYNLKATILTSDNCSFLVIYSPKAENFFCLEPVTHCNDAINMAANGQLDTGLLLLAQSEQLSISMKIIPEVIAENI